MSKKSHSLEGTTQNLILTDVLISTAKSNGVKFGSGDPINRIRYFIKLGLLPKQVRKYENGGYVAYIPSDALDKLIRIQELTRAGYKVSNLTPNHLKYDDITLFPITEISVAEALKEVEIETTQVVIEKNDQPIIADASVVSAETSVIVKMPLMLPAADPALLAAMCPALSQSVAVGDHQTEVKIDRSDLIADIESLENSDEVLVSEPVIVSKATMYSDTKKPVQVKVLSSVFYYTIALALILGFGFSYNYRNEIGQVAGLYKFNTLAQINYDKHAKVPGSEGYDKSSPEVLAASTDYSAEPLPIQQTIAPYDYWWVKIDNDNFGPIQNKDVVNFIPGRDINLSFDYDDSITVELESELNEIKSIKFKNESSLAVDGDGLKINSETLKLSADLSISAGNDIYIGGSPLLADVIGDREYDYEYFVTSGETITESINRLDYELGNFSGGGSSYWDLNGNQLYALSMSYNVGIGTTNPQYKLDVNGTFRTSGVVNFGGIAAGNAATTSVLALDPSNNVELLDISSYDTTAADDLTTSTVFAGDLSGAYNNLQLGSGVVGATELASSGVTPNTYGDGSNIPSFTVDADGRITSVTLNAVSSYSGWTLVADSGSSQSISSGNTATFVGGTGIGTIASATDTLTLNIATTEISDTTFGSGTDFTWTFDPSGATDPTITFANNSITIGSAALNIGTINLTGTGTLNGLDSIDSTTESTLEAALDISGDVTGTGLNSVSVIKINGATLGTTTASSGNLLIANGTSWVSTALSGDITVDSSGVTTIGANTIALGTDTTGNYVATLVDAGSGIFTIANSGTESAGVTIDIANGSISNAKLANSSITFAGDTGSGAISLGGTITATGGTGISTSYSAGAITITNSDRGSSQNIFKTISVSGQSDVVTDANSDTLTLVAGSNVTITTNATADSITIASTDTNTTYSAGSGLTLSSTTFNLGGTLTADAAFTGAYDIVLGNASSEIRILESNGATYYGTIDVDDLSADATYKLSGATGFILTDQNAASYLTAWDQDASNDLTTSSSFGGDVSGTYNNIQLGTGVVGATELAATTVSAGTYGDSTNIPTITVDADGRITSISNNSITYDNYGSWTISGDSGSETVASGNTVSVVGGTNGIDTVVTSTDTLTLNIDTTEIGPATFGSGSDFTWTFNPLGATNPTLAFADNSVTIGSAVLNVGTITLTGTGTLNGLDSIDATGESTLEAALDIAGDVTGTGLGSVTVAKINGANLGVTTASAANILIGDGDSWESTAITGDITISSGGVTTIGVNTVALGTDTTGNYVATLADAGNGFFTVTGSGSETAGVTIDIANDSLNFAQFSDTLSLDASTDIAVDNAEVFSITNTGTANSFVVNDTSTDPTPFVIDTDGNVGIGLTNPAAKLAVISTSEQLRLGYDGSNYGAFTLSSSGDLSLDLIGGDLTLASGDNLNLTSGADLIFGGTTALNETTGATDSGAYIVGAFDEFTYSSSTNVQAVLNDLDAAIATLSAGAYTQWSLAGDLGTPEVVLSNDTASILGGTNGIDTVVSATDTLTLNLDTTEIGTTTFGSGSDFTQTFDASAGTDVTTAYGDGIITSTLSATGFYNILTGNLKVGNGTPDATLNGEDGYVEGTLEVDGASRFDGALSANSTLGVSGAATLSGGTTLNRTLSANSGTTTNVASLTFTTPADTTGTNVNQGLNITPTIGNATGGTNTANIINIAALTGDAQVSLNAINLGALTGTAATETAINIGAGWDSVLTVNGTTVINGSGQVTSGAISGTIFNTNSDSGSSTLIQGDTLAINGTSTGIDTTLSGDTYTIALDTTEIGTTIFGTGSGITWTFDASAGTDVTTAYGDGSITSTLSATGLFNLLTGNLKVGNGVPTLSQDGEDAYIEGVLEVDGVSTFGGNVGIGTTSPTSLLSVGASSQFQVNSSGAIAAVTGITTSGSYTQSGSSTNTFTGATSVTTVNAAGGSANALTLSGTLGAFNGSDTFRGLYLNYTNANHTLTSNVFNGLDIAAITGDADATETAIAIGSGWDSALSVNGTTVVNGSGQLVASQLTGTIFSTNSDSGSSTLIQGDTLAVNGGTNGIDTVLSGDTYTLNLDTTEIGTTIFGTGSGITWTFDAGATDPSMVLASASLSLNPGSSTGTVNVLTGNLKVGNGTPTVSQDGEDAYVEGVLEVDGVSTFGGNVGIGTTNPGSLLEVTSGTPSYVSANVYNNRTALVHNSYVYGGSDNDYANFQSNLRVASTSNNPELLTGVLSSVFVPSGNAINHGAIYGTSSNFTHEGTGTIATVKGGYFDLSNSDAGTFTEAYGGTFNIANSATGTITDLWGTNVILTNSGTMSTAKLSSVELTNAGTIGSTYGYYVGDITSGTQTNTAYSVFASDANAYNYFAGAVGIGTSTPGQMLTVAGGSIAVDQGAWIGTSGFTGITPEANTTSALYLNSVKSTYLNIDSDSNDSDNQAFYFTKNHNGEGGTALMTLTEAGSLGIGTTNPGSLLEVVGKGQFGTAAASTAQLVVLGGSGGHNLIELTRTSGATLTYGWNLSGGQLSFNNVTNSKTTLQTTWNGSSSVITAGMNYGTGLGIAGDPGIIKSGDSSPDGTNLSGGSLSLQSGLGTGNATTQGILFGTPDATVSGTTTQAYSTKMVLTGTGNLGIGTTAPGVKLVVNGGTQEIITPNGTLSKLRLTQTGQNNWDLAIPASSGRFEIQEGANPRFTIAATTGNVGIGTTAPGYTFDVTGMGRFTGNLYSTSSNQDAIKTRFLSGAASGSTSDGTLYIQYGKTQNVSIGETGTSSLFVSGNVGIGLINPAAKFHVQSTSTSTVTGIIQAAASQTANLTQWRNSAGTVLSAVDASGNLGIGTASPTSILDVLGSSAAIFTRAVAGAGSPDSAIQIGLKETTATNGGGPSFLFFGNNSAGTKSFTGRLSSIWENVSAGSEAAGIAFSVRANSADTTASTERMRITAAGNVGIGTTNPDKLLHVNGSSRFGNLVISTSNPGTADTGKGIWADGAGTGVLGLTSTTGISFSGNGTSESVRINSSGNVGIGTTSPGYRLDVNGTVRFGNAASGLDSQVSIGKSSTWNSENSAGLRIEDGTQDTGILIGADAANDFAYIQSLDPGTSYSTRPLLINPNGGNVGIGTTNPAGRLDVTYTSNTAATISLTNNTATTIGNGADTTGVLDLQSTSLTTGNFMNIELNALTTGKGINLKSTSTALSSGNLINLYWNPGSSTTATGDLFKLDIGANALLSGNLFALYNNGTEIFSVDTAKITSALPHEFTASGGVSFAYDAIFTNQTASQIESYGPLTIVSGESFENLDLTLKAYGTGAVVVDNAALELYTGEKLVLDTNDTGDSYFAHNNTGNYVSVYTDNTEVARFMADGSVDGNTTFDANEFDIAEYYPTLDKEVEAGDVVSLVSASEENQQETSSYLIAKADPTVQNNVLGIVSTKPGFSMGGGSFRSEFCALVMEGEEGEIEARKSLFIKEIKDSLLKKEFEIEALAGLDLDSVENEFIIAAEISKLYEEYKNNILGNEGFESIVPETRLATIEDKINSCKAEKQVPVALAGRVPVKVDSTNGEIKAGDLLAPSITNMGRAMKAVSAGWVIGRAIEDYKEGTDTVMVYVFTSWYGGEGSTANGVNSTETLTLDQKLNNMLNVTTVEGRSTLGVVGNLVGTGNITSANITASGIINAGLIRIDSTNNSISSLGSKLYVQKDAGSLDVDFFNGKLTITPDGSLISLAKVEAKQIASTEFKVLGSNTATSSATVGEGLIQSGDNQVVIENTFVKESSKIFVTPITKTDGRVLVVESKESGRFTVSIDESFGQDIKFDYWIVQTE